MTDSDCAHDEAQVATPALIVDLSTAEHNVQQMAAYCREHGLSLRPHTKTHKSRQMSQRQLDAGAGGLTVAKLGEAKTMAEVCDDLLLAYPAVDLHRAAGIAALAKDRMVRVAVDSVAAIEALSRAAIDAESDIGVLIDVDTGHHRTGLQTVEDAVSLARTVQQHAGVRFDGLLTFPGHIMTPHDQQAVPLRAVADVLESVLDALAAAGLNAEIVSGGSTPTALRSHLVPQLTEIRPGTYIYYDWNCASGGWCTLEDCAARVVCTVISDAVPGKVVVDAGSKTLTSDRLVTDPDAGGYGYVVECSAARITRLSEEHGEITWPSIRRRPAVGDRLHIIPNHICPCINLQSSYWLRHDDDTLILSPVDARGLLV